MEWLVIVWLVFLYVLWRLDKWSYKKFLIYKSTKKTQETKKNYKDTGRFII